MEIELKEKPKNPIVIEGVPGLGLVGTIVTEFLIDHLKAKPIGKLQSKNLPAILAVHQGKILEPFGIFYSKEHNVMIISALETVQGMEGELADAIVKICDMVKARDLICVEGFGSSSVGEPQAFYITEDLKKRKKLEGIGVKPLKDGVIFGVTAALLAKSRTSNFIFSEAHSELPDSRSAAKIIQVLDKYLGLNVDYQPLIEKANSFEKKLKELLTMASQKAKDKAKDTYLG